MSKAMPASIRSSVGARSRGTVAVRGRVPPGRARPWPTARSGGLGSASSYLARRGPRGRRSLAGFGRLARQLPRPLAWCLAGVVGDECLGQLARLVVGALVVRRLHQVARGSVELAGDPLVQG